MPGLAEALAAVRTHVGLFSCVSVDVCLQSGGHPEPLPTVRTDVGPFSSVNKHVFVHMV